MKAPLLLVSVVSLFAGLCDAPEPVEAPEPAVEEVVPMAGPADGFVSVSVDGRPLGCGLRVDGSVRCWGWGPAAVSPEGRFSAVSVAYDAACGIRIDGEIHCWGEERWGLLSPPTGVFSSISMGEGSACGVRADGSLACWGEWASSWPVPDGEFRMVDVDGETACGVRHDGAVICWDRSGRDPRLVVEGPFRLVDVWSWGFECGVLESGKLECWDRGGDRRWSPLAGTFVDVVVNQWFACGVRTDGEVACWGQRESENCYGGTGETCGGWGNDPLPAGPFTSISVGPWPPAFKDTICGVRADGRLRCWNDGSPRRRPPTGEFAAIDVDGAMCGLRTGGQAVCWGAGVGWQADIPPGGFTAVSGSGSHACGLRPGGEAECWGDNTWGAAAPPPGEFTAVDTGWRLSCGLRPGGDVECWGDNSSGATDPPEGPFVAVEARYEHACGLRDDGTAVCWGRGWDPESGDPGRVFATPDFGAPSWQGTYPVGAFDTVSASGLVACGIRPAGTVECWSPYWPPGLGVPDLDEPLGGSAFPVAGPPRRGVPEKLEWVRGELPGGPYVALDSSWYHTCGVRADGTVECHGHNARSPDGEFTAIDLGPWDGCGFRRGGELTCWDLAREELDREPQFALSPTESVVLTDSALGGSCALLNTGDIVCTADLPVRLPDRITGPYEQITVGGGWVAEPWAHGPSEETAHVCALGGAGRIGCWGENRSGQTALPPPWLDDPPYRAVAAGFAHSCAIGASGAVVCWGDGRHGQNRSPEGTFTALGAGQWHTCGLRGDGEVVCWGDGPAEVDQVFDDPPPGRPSEPPAGPFSSLAVGEWHSCALRPDGTAACWLSY